MAVKDNTLKSISEKGILYFQCPLYRGDDTMHTEFINKNIDKCYAIFIGAANTNAGYIGVDSKTAVMTTVIDQYNSYACCQIKMIQNLKKGDKVYIKGTSTPVLGSLTASTASLKLIIEGDDCQQMRNTIAFTNTYSVTGHNKTVYALVTSDMTYGYDAKITVNNAEGNPESTIEDLFISRPSLNECCLFQKITNLNSGDTISCYTGGGSNRYGNVVYITV